MPSPLVPALTGSTLALNTILDSPTRLRGVIEKIIGDNLVLAQMFSPLGEKVSGGGILYNRVTAADRLLLDGENRLKERAPGAEYPFAQGVDPESKLAVTKDYGVLVEILDEERDRVAPTVVAQRLVQAANALTIKLDDLAIAAVEAALTDAGSQPIPGNKWELINTVGPDANLTPSNQRFAADIAAARLVADLEELGTNFDSLMVHPQEAFSLRTAYGAGLQAELDSAGVTLIVNARMEPGTAYVFQRQGVGRVGFERELTVETERIMKRRVTQVLTYAVPAFAVDGVHRVKKITGLHT